MLFSAPFRRIVKVTGVQRSRIDNANEGVYVSCPLISDKREKSKSDTEVPSAIEPIQPMGLIGLSGTRPKIAKTRIMVRNNKGPINRNSVLALSQTVNSLFLPVFFSLFYFARMSVFYLLVNKALKIMISGIFWSFTCTCYLLDCFDIRRGSVRRALLYKSITIPSTGVCRAYCWYGIVKQNDTSPPHQKYLMGEM